MTMHRWPSRRPPTGKRNPPGIKHPGTKPSPKETASRDAASRPSVPYRIPSRRLDALVSSIWILLVLSFLVLFLFYLHSLWLPEGVPRLIVYFATLSATVLAVVLFSWSLLGYVLPRLVGLRGPPAVTTSGKD